MSDDQYNNGQQGDQEMGGGMGGETGEETYIPVYVYLKGSGKQSYAFSFYDTDDYNNPAKFSDGDGDYDKFTLEPETYYKFIYKSSGHQFQIQTGSGTNGWKDAPTTDGLNFKTSNAPVKWQCKAHPINSYYEMAGSIEVVASNSGGGGEVSGQDTPGTYYLQPDDTGKVLKIHTDGTLKEKNAGNWVDLSNNSTSDSRIGVKQIILEDNVDLSTNFLLDIECDNMGSILIDGKGHDIGFNGGSRNGIIALNIKATTSEDSEDFPLKIKHLKIMMVQSNSIAQNNSVIFKSITCDGEVNTKVALIDSVQVSGANLTTKSSGFIPKAKGTYIIKHCTFNGQVSDTAAGFVLNNEEEMYVNIQNSYSWLTNNANNDAGAGFVDTDNDNGSNSKFIFENCFTNAYFTVSQSNSYNNNMVFEKSVTTKKHYKRPLSTDATTSDILSLKNNYESKYAEGYSISNKKMSSRHNYMKNKPKQIKYQKKDNTQSHNIHSHHAKDNNMQLESMSELTEDMYGFDTSGNNTNERHKKHAAEEKQRNMLAILDPNNEKYRIDNETGEIYLKTKKYELSKYKDDNGNEFIQFDGADLTGNIKDDIVIKITGTDPSSNVTDSSYVGIAMPGFRDYIDRCDIKINRNMNYKFVLDISNITKIELLKPQMDGNKVNTSANFINITGQQPNISIKYFHIKADVLNSINIAIKSITIRVTKTNGKVIDLIVDILPILRRMPKRTIYTNTIDVSGESHRFDSLDWVKVKVDDEDKDKPMADIIDFKQGHNIDQSMFSMDASGHLLMHGKPLYQYNDLTHNIVYDEEIEKNNNAFEEREKTLKPWNEDIIDDNMRYKNTKANGMKMDIQDLLRGNKKMKSDSGHINHDKYNEDKYKFKNNISDISKIPIFFQGVSWDGRPPLGKKFKDMEITDTSDNRRDMEKVREFARSINSSNIVNGIAKNAIDFTKLKATDFKANTRFSTDVSRNENKSKRRKAICLEIFENCHKDIKVLECPQIDLPFDLDDMLNQGQSIYENNKESRKIKLINHKVNQGDLSDVTLSISNLNTFYCPKDISGEQIKIKFKYENDSENNLYLLDSTEKETEIDYKIHKYDSNLQLINTPVLSGTVEHKDTSSVTLDNKNLLITAGSTHIATTGSAGSEGDPYITPLNGVKYKLPNENATYCLYGYDDILINATVRKATDKMSNEIRSYYVKHHGPVPKNLELVTDGYFYRHIFFKSENFNLMINLETKEVISNDEEMKYFNIKMGALEKETKGLFKNEPLIKTTIEFNHSKHGLISYHVKFYENPQIRNGIYIGNVINTAEAIGLCISNYKPYLMKVNSANENNINVLKERLENVSYRNRFTVHDIKEGEEWISKTLKK